MWDERFARQYHDKHHSEFPQSSPFPGVVHHLSGPAARHPAKTQSFVRGLALGHIVQRCHINFVWRGRPARLWDALDSLIRVSRRAGHIHVPFSVMQYSNPHRNTLKRDFHATNAAEHSRGITTDVIPASYTSWHAQSTSIIYGASIYATCSMLLAEWGRTRHMCRFI